MRRVTRTWIAVATSAQRLDAQRQIRLRNVVLFALCVLSIVLMMASLEVALVMPEDDDPRHKASRAPLFFGLRTISCLLLLRLSR